MIKYSDKTCLRSLLGLLFGGFGQLGQHFIGMRLGRHGEAQARAAVQVALAHGARQVADAADVGGALGYRDGAARVQQVEGVGGLEHLLVRWQRQLRFHQLISCAFVGIERAEQEIHIRMLEVVGGLLHLVLVEHVTVAQAVGIDQVVHRFLALQVHGQALQAVRDFAGGRLAVNTSDLLEVGELGHFHAVEPDFPAQAPSAQRGVLPVVFHKADVVFLQIKAQRFERAQVQLQDVVGRGLQDHLELVVVLQAVGVLAIAAILGATAGLHVGGLPRLGADGAQEGGGVRRAGADFHVIGLEQCAAVFGPVGLQFQNDLLEGQHGV